MITIVGAGFAGVEAAWACANRDVPVRLYEMRPESQTPAHTTGWFAELVCSNSFKSKLPTSPAGQLKAEMLGLGSLVLETALRHEVPGGQALAVDRNAFAKSITDQIEGHPNVEVFRETFTPEMAGSLLAGNETLILASGPLTSPPLADWLAKIAGRQHLYFYDAVSPTLEAASVDRSVAFDASRYGKGGDDYLNCPFDRDSYYAFVEALISAERAPIHAFEAGGKRDATGEASEGEFLERVQYFAGCTPIEAIADKGVDSLRFGNFKPVGLTDPRTERRPFAALQLRPENAEKTLYSLVACQTRLKWGDQKRVFQMIPGLERAEFVRYGVIHRNTFLEAPKLLSAELEMKDHPGLYVTGQLTGVEGYVESAAMGIYSGIVAANRVRNQDTPPPPRASAYGSLVAHLQDTTPREFAPMNINWGLFPDPEEPTRDKGQRRIEKIAAALAAFTSWKQTLV